MLEFGAPFFARHGPKAVFIGRWISGLRTFAALLAGATGMSWRGFAVWNALGAIAWSTSVGLLAYFLGKSSAGLFTIVGLFALGGVALPVIALLVRRSSTDSSRGDPQPAP